MAVLLTACGAVHGPKGAAFRDASEPIRSLAGVSLAATAGQWQQIADFRAVDSIARCHSGSAEIGDDGRRFIAQLCLDGVRRNLRAMANPGIPGRFDGATPVWVLWMDGDGRVMALGTPSGEFGAILARDGLARSDLIAAATEILDWNGYDTTRLVIWHRTGRDQ